MRNTEKQDNDAKTTRSIRLSKSLLDQIDTIAEKERRSANNLITLWIEKAVDDYNKHNK